MNLFNGFLWNRCRSWYLHNVAFYWPIKVPLTRSLVTWLCIISARLLRPEQDNQPSAGETVPQLNFVRAVLPPPPPPPPSHHHYLLFLLLVIRHFSPLSGHGFNAVGVSRLLSIHEFKIRPKPSWQPAGQGNLCAVPRSKRLRCWWPYQQLDCSRHTM